MALPPDYFQPLSYLTKPEKSTMSPYRYFLKRLSNIYYDKDDKEKALKVYEAFFVLEPSDFYASDFMKFAEILISSGLMIEQKKYFISAYKRILEISRFIILQKKNSPKRSFPLEKKEKEEESKASQKFLLKHPF